MQRIVVVGGGIVGLASAYKILARRPSLRVTVLEKEADVGRHQSTHNSGVLHAGLYYRPGSAKARLAREGIREMVAFCDENGIRHEVCGKLVVAADESELPRLRELFDRGRQNELRGLEMLSAEQAREIEPHVAGVAAVRVPEEGIVDYAAVCRTLVAKIEERGGSVVTRARVSSMQARNGGWVVRSTAGEHQAAFIVTCAGLHADRVSALAGERPTTRIVPFRGEYYKLRPGRTHLVRNLIYPVPDPAFPFLGVHFTRMIAGGVEAGPNAVLALAREGYTKTRVSLRDTLDALAFRGLRRFLARYPRMCWAEIKRSFSRELFCRSLQRLVPDVQPDDLVPGGAGVRAQALAADGTLVQDFEFIMRPNAVHLLNAPSPGATASLAIGDEVATAVLARLAPEGVPLNV